MKYKNDIIVLIYYYNDIPDTVLTETGMYEFERFNGDGFLMFDDSQKGSISVENKKIGNEIATRIGTPVKLEDWKIWVENGYSYDVPVGVELLKKPLMLLWYNNNFHNNPFIVGNEVDFIYFCEKCGKSYNDDGCLTHGFDMESE